MRELIKYTFILLLFLLISGFVLSKILLDDRLIGRSIDYSVPPVDYLVNNVFKSNLYTWNPIPNGGVKNSFSPTLIPLNLILYAPSLLGFANVMFISRYQLLLSVFLCLFFSFLLVKKLLDDTDLSETLKYIGAILGGFLYTFNSYFFVELHFGSSVMYLTYAFIPLALFSYLSYIKEGKMKWFLITLFSLVITSSTIQHLIVLYFFLFILSIINKKIFPFFKLGLLHFFLCLYWILPLAYFYSDISSNELVGDYTAGLVNSSTKFFRAFINSDYFGNRDMYRIALGSSFLSNIWSFSSLGLVLLCLLPVFYIEKVSSKFKKYIYIFTIVFLGSLLFIKGGREPFGSIVLKIFNNLPLINVFKSVQRFFSFYMLAELFLFTFSFYILVRKNFRFMFLFIFCLFFVSMPWWYTRDLGIRNISNITDHPTLGMFKLTEGSSSLYELNNNPLEFNILNVPMGHSINFLPINPDVMQTQGGDAGLFFGNKGFYAPEISASGFNRLLDNMEFELYTNKNFFDDYFCLFSLLNIKCVALREDVTPNFSKHNKRFDAAFLKESILEAHVFSDIRVVNYGVIGEIGDNYYLSPIYVPSTVKYTKLSEKYPSSYCIEDVIDPLILFSKDNKNKILPEEGALNSNTGVVFEKVNPTKYKIILSNVTKTFPLVFTQNFHRGWGIYEGDTSFLSDLFKRSVVKDMNHFYANGYFNGWNISPEEFCALGNSCVVNKDGSYNMYITLEYFPQKLLYIGALLSGVFVVFFLTVEIIRKKINV